MNIQLFLISETKKCKNRPLKAHEQHQFSYLREFINFCLNVKEKITDTTQINEQVYSNYVRYLTEVKKNTARTRLDKCLVVKAFLEKYHCTFIPNPWRAYERHTGRHKKE